MLPTPDQIDLVLYHRNCLDGFMAAWAAWKHLGDKAEYVAIQYGEDPPDLKGRYVALVDFSFPRPVLEKAIEESAGLVLFDHHKSARVEVEGFPNSFFDLDKSGAMLTWEWFHPGKIPPQAVFHTQDRDLWRWEMENTREFYLGIQNYRWKFDYIEEFDAAVSDVAALIERGKVLASYIDLQIKLDVKKAILVEAFGHKMWMVNHHSPWYSELGHALCTKDGVGLALLWFYHGEQRSIICSLRSDGRVDAGAIAKIMGGGGHPGAAGFVLKSTWHPVTIEQIVRFLPKGD